MVERSVSESRPRVNKAALDALYERLNKREYVSPDPLEVLYDYPDLQDREIAALVASSLAFGGVKQIVTSVRKVLKAIDPPSVTLAKWNRGKLAAAVSGFKHRWAAGADMAALLWGAAEAIRLFGTLEACFAAKLNGTVQSALTGFATAIAGDGTNPLLPIPSRGSACKRLHLFLRWLVRKDAVDPGGWTCVSPSMLTIPLDTHMFRISRALGLTARKTAGAKCAEEITAAFRTVSPEDPVKYDFALTRLGIRSDQDLHAFVQEYGAQFEGKAFGPADSSEFQG
ncbi:MAG: TIGR02757 family protein [bacterium]